MIGICTDSNAQLPVAMVERYGIEVVPLTVTIDGVAHLEGVDLDADAFYAHFDRGHRPEVSTAAPGPGLVALAHRRLVEAGATEIVSIHVGSDVSGTLNAARLAVDEAGVPVRLVDTGSASFVVGCAVWEAAEAVRAGRTAEEVATIAKGVAARCGNLFVVGTLDLARAGGRLGAGVEAVAVPVLELAGGTMQVVDEVRSPEAAADAMATLVLQADGSLRAGVGHSDASSLLVADHLAEVLADSGRVEVVRYRVGPSVGAHTGPGTAGAVFYRLEERG